MSRYIPIDMMSEILKRLPVESLLRFRSVCRWMNQIIDSPIFIQHHLALLNHPRFIAIYQGREILLVNPHDPSIASALIIRRSESEHVNLVGTLHGIVCVYYYRRHFLLSNISIQKTRILPLPDFTKPAFADIAFKHGYTYDDDGEANAQKDGRFVFSGFWIDPATKEFKIVIFELMVPENWYLYPVILYSSITQNWKPLRPFKVTMSPFLSQTPAVVIGNVGYWRIFKHFEERDEQNKEWIGTDAFIISFDFETETFYMIETPFMDYTLRYPQVLSRWQDTLSLVCVDLVNVCEVYFWDARGTGKDSWRKMLIFNLPATDVTYITSTLSMVKSEGQEIDLEEELLESRRILAATRTELVLCDNGPDCMDLKSELPDDYTLSVAYDYVDSLLFPDRALDDV